MTAPATGHPPPITDHWSPSTEYAARLAARREQIAALDRTHVKSDARIAGAREIAFFPPVTGG